MKVLLTGGTGFLGAHCVDALLQRNHTIVFTTRSREKGNYILANHPNSKGLSYVVVEDIARDNAFDNAVQSDPPFEAVIHTASPYHFSFTDAKKEMFDPVVLGTTGLLKSLQQYAPAVKRVAITSSFAAMVNVKSHPKVYDGSTWNDVTLDEVLHTDKFTAWRGSKTFAERAAWDFVENEKPNFQVSSINPPLMFGPLRQPFGSVDTVNQSVERIRDMIQGKMKDKLAPTGIYIWTDVRDVALANVLAIEVSKAAGKRFLCTAGFYTNAGIADVIKKNFPQLKDKLPDSYERDFDMNNKPYDIDNSQSKTALGLEYRSLEQSITDSVDSLLAAGV